MNQNVPVMVAGSYQTDFARKWSVEGSGPLRAMLDEAAHRALQDACLLPSDVETIHVGNLAGELFEGQAHLGPLVVDTDPAWNGLPASRHEAACASGSVAVLAAMAEIQAGYCDVALVIGVESMRAAGGAQAARHLGCAAWVEEEVIDETLPWPSLFDRLAEEVDKRYGLDPGHLAQIAWNNRTNALMNPLAQTRTWELDEKDFQIDSASNPSVYGRILKNECGLVTDGAAAVVLTSANYLADRRDIAQRSAALLGWGHACAPIGLEEKLRLSADAPYIFPNVRSAIKSAYDRARIPGPESLDAIETHDCFAITEYAVLDHFGLTEPGQSWRAVEDGSIALGGRLPVNPSGGLIGLGHPVGATGVRMLHSARQQVIGEAGRTQVDGATTIATLNIGGSASTAVSFVVGNANA